MTPQARPLLCNGYSVRAILEDRKTKTRRTCGLEDVNRYAGILEGKSPLGPLGYKGLDPSDYYVRNKTDYKKHPGQYHWFMGMQTDGREINPIPVKCPYGAVGDRLWVKETWADLRSHISETYPNQAPVVYQADDVLLVGEHWKSSLFMPRWASRLLLEITSIRAERVQDISEEDVLAEGLCLYDYTMADGSVEHHYNTERLALGAMPLHHQDAFRRVWNAINFKRGYGWDRNPWVWVIEFKRLEGE